MRLITEYLDNAAKLFPNKIAFADSEKELTFLGLKEESYKIATVLTQRNLFKKPIIIFLDKTVSCISSFMGVAYSGNFYTPIDTKMPIERINKIIEILQPEIILTDYKNIEVAKQLNYNFDFFLYEELMQEIINIDNIEASINKIIDTDVLYVLFTSGSTGMPKGVIINHRAVIDYTEWVTETFKITNRDIFGNQAPFYFDNSVLDIYQTLKNAASMYIIPENLFAFPMKLLEYLKDKKVNVIFWVPSALCLVSNLKALKGKVLPNLTKILFAGEVMPNKQLNMWRRAFPHAFFANLYGPTEITVDCTYYIVDREFQDDESLPIGKACKNTDILVLNENNELVSNNEIGELCVRGTLLAMGYYNNSEKTEASFVQNPLNHAYSEFIYRTGDLVRYNEYGELMYVSRKDFQIKHMGHRIELGEIETVVSAAEGVDLNCCLYDEIHKKIVLFYTGIAPGDNIIKFLKAKLPEYMIPHKKIKLNDMPLNLNGKIDRIKLRKLL